LKTDAPSHVISRVPLSTLITYEESISMYLSGNVEITLFFTRKPPVRRKQLPPKSCLICYIK